MSIFKLPDLGEGLQDAEIVEWHVKIGDEIKLDEPLVSVETDKAVVDIPSPEAGEIHNLFGSIGDIINVGDPLVEFSSGSPEMKQQEVKTDNSGSVVGEVKESKSVIAESALRVGLSAHGLKVTPAVRALAHRLDVDLSIITPTGPDGMISAKDVERVAKILTEVGPMKLLRGTRRTMARTMSQAHAEVVPVTVSDDADIDAWAEKEDVTMRLIRAIVSGCKAEPSLNAWYDSHAVGRRILEKIDLGIALDTKDGLFVPVLRDVSNRNREDLRSALNKLKQDVHARKIPAEELRGYTFTLSNFGTFGGRYANPIVVPPTVAILGAGHIRLGVVAVNDRAVVHHILPLSLTFDHRSVTGGEATRFLARVIDDLVLSE
ncbi:MAG: dihydrolipoamide acetyltransferase family protein [Gammaproteobacteria bacterium]